MQNHIDHIDGADGFGDLGHVSPASRTPGLFVVAELRRAGVSEREIRALRRQAHRVRRGVYAPAPPAEPDAAYRLRILAVVATHRSRVVFSHVSAAAVHRLPLWGLPLHLVHVLTQSKPSTGAGVKYHARPPEPPVDVGRLSVTTVARTVWDCARGASLAAGVALGDAALREQLTTPAELEAVATAGRGQAGAARGRSAIAALDPRSESVGESRARLIIIGLGYEIASQYEVRLGSGSLVRTDFRIRGTRVLIEFDGRVKYDSPQVLWDEKLRADRLADRGFQLVRLVWADLDHPATIDQRIRSALARDRHQS